MTRKSQKGTTGKGITSRNDNSYVGVGLDFKRENVTNTKEIEQAVKEKRK